MRGVSNKHCLLPFFSEFMKACELLKVKVISLPYIFQVLYVLCFTRPRYQVSVYRTIGPLVICSIPIYNFECQNDWFCINLQMDRKVIQKHMILTYRNVLNSTQCFTKAQIN